MRLTTILLAFGVVVAGGCAMIDTDVPLRQGSFLQPVRPSPSSVALEVFWARYPLASPQIDNELWMEVDESRIPPTVRRRLAESGFRAGVVGSEVPDALAEVLELGHGGNDRAANHGEELASLLAESTVTRQRRQLPPDVRWELHASEIIAEAPLLSLDNGELVGRTLRDAQAVYAIEHHLESDGRIRLSLTPELQEGPPQLKFQASDGLLRQAPLRDREVFGQLGVEVTLSPGEMLVMTGAGDSGSQLARYFHTVEGTAGLERKLIVVRLAQVPDSQIFVH